MIKVKDYKAFHGVMKVTPKSMIVPTFELEADWLYIPDKKVWIANDVEYSEEICTVVRDDSEVLQFEVRLLRDDNRNLQDLCNKNEKLIKVLYEGIVRLITRLERYSTAFKERIRVMAGFIAKQPNGLYCRFSTVTDCPTDWNMTAEDYIELCKQNAEIEAKKVLEKYIQPFDSVKNSFLPTNMTKSEYEQFLKDVSN